MDGKRERKGGEVKNIVPLKLSLQPSQWIKIVLYRMHSRRRKFCV